MTDTPKLDLPQPVDSARKASILTVHGADRPTDIGGGQTTNAGSTDLYRLLGSAVRTEQLIVTRHMFRQAKRPLLDPYRHVMNVITDPDQNPRVLGHLSRLLKGYRGTIINHPDAVLRSTRDKIAARLAGVPGLIAPKVLRFQNSKPDAVTAAIARAGLAFPLIVRRAGTHGGKVLGLCQDLAEVLGCIEPQGEHFATEFVDYRSADGFYRKARVYFIGRHRVLRHMLASPDWNVHAGDGHRFMLEHPELLVEEERMFALPQGAFPTQVQDVLDAVRERIDLDFFGIDFGIAQDGRVVLFEANATMNFLPFIPDVRYDYIQRCILPAQIALWELVGLTHPSAR